MTARAHARATRSLLLVLGLLLFATDSGRGQVPTPAPQGTAPEAPRTVTGTTASLLEADRALSATAAEDGLREAIVARALGYAIILTPNPVGAHPWLREHEPPFNHRQWVSEEVEVSSSGMLGYTISRWRTRPPAPGAPAAAVPAASGRQIIAWRFHPMTGWKVLLYAAIGQPDAAGSPDSVRARSLSPLHGDHLGTHDEAHTEAVALQEFDATLGELAASKGWKAALADHLAEDVVWLREGAPLVRGRPAAVATLATDSCGCRCTTIGAHAADATDLAYTYGKCVTDSAFAAGAVGPGTSWVRVWRKDREGVRRVVVVFEMPIPPGEQK